MEQNLTIDELQFYTYVWSLAGGTNDDATLSGSAAVPILEASNLDQETLAEMWNICDEGGHGHLTFDSFCGFLRLIAHKQNNSNPHPQLIFETPPSLPMLDLTNFDEPEMNYNNMAPIDHELVSVPYLHPDTVVTGSPGQLDLRTNVDWTVSAYEKAEYIKLFTEYDLNGDGCIEGHEARSLFSKSGLPDNVLYCIWNLADRGKKGRLDLGEFIVASHIISKVLENADVPLSVPPSLEVEFNPTDKLASDIFTHHQPIQNVVTEPVGDAFKEDSLEKGISLGEEKPMFDTDMGADPFDMDISNEKEPAIEHFASKDYSVEAFKFNGGIKADTSIEENRPPKALDDDFPIIRDDDFKFRPSVKFNDDGMDPVAILSAAIESDRALTQRTKNMADPLYDDIETLKHLNRSLVDDIKYHKEQLQTQLIRLAAAEEEVSNLRSQYEDLNDLRRKVVNEVTCVKQDVSNAQDQRAFLTKAVTDCQNELDFLGNMMSDIKISNERTNATLVESAKTRADIAELIRLYDEKRKAEDLEIADLQMTHQRLVQEQQRIQTQSRNHLEKFRQDTQDQNLINNSLVNSNTVLYKLSQNLIDSGEVRHELLNKVHQCLSNTGTVNTSPMSRPIRDKKGIPVSSDMASPVKHGVNVNNNWLQFNNNKTPFPTLEPLTVNNMKSETRNVDTGLWNVETVNRNTDFQHKKMDAGHADFDVEPAYVSRRDSASRRESHITKNSVAKFSDAKSHLSGDFDSIFNRM